MPAKKNILVVLEYGDVLPSGIVRGLIYRSCFERNGYRACFVNRQPAWLLRLLLFPPAGLRWFLRGPPGTALGFLLRLFSRLSELRIVRIARRYDVVYMTKVLSHSLIAALKANGARIVLDFGDAMWLPGKARRFDDTLRAVDAVTTDNDVTAEYVRPLNHECTVIPDCPQVERFDQRREGVKKATDCVTIGWIGSPTTVYNLFVVWEALEQVFLKHSNVRLRLVGVGQDAALRLPPFEAVRFTSVSNYSQAEMIDEVLKMDIGLFPLQDVTACRVRGVLKAAIYMAGEAAVVGSPVGQCSDFIRDGVNGYLARTTEEWISRMDRLIDDAAHRQDLARNGLALVRREFTVESSFKKLIAVLDPPKPSQEQP